MSTVVRAIDVGFGTTKFVTTSEEGKVECSHFPSVSYFGGVDKLVDAEGRVLNDKTRDLLVKFLQSFGTWIERNIRAA